jgi:chemosensory pili system protein ChpA (sensor histidine kinase/response regulator)
LPGVLIVDDALSVRNSLMQLVQDAGYRAEAARDGIEAIGTLRAFKPDIVLTDLEMPNMNGIELTAHIRGREDLKNLPVIMITSRSQEKHRRLAEQAGVDTYLTKPYNDAELLQSIRQALTA